MRKTKVTILGGSGMLGSMLVDWFSRDPDLSVTATVRSPSWIQAGKNRIPEVDWRLFELGDEAVTAHQLATMGPADWVINAIGLTKPYTHDDNGAEIQQAILGNATFPYLLGRYYGERGGQFLQIATDCVYSGFKGDYVEKDPHDALEFTERPRVSGRRCFPTFIACAVPLLGQSPSPSFFCWNGFGVNPATADCPAL
ncbi:MAG: hypothetical protein U0V70_15680 [Terriglobia bacterium]